jgi:sensor histidine kinase regulating citrate/malate metabolism
MEKLMTNNRERQLYRFVLDSIPLAMVTMDYDFKITSFTKQAERLTGYLSDEALGKSCYEILNSSRCEYDCPLQGRGIMPDEIPYIFDAFYQSVSEEEVGGHGLGLPAANTIIRQHGGRISVESKPGKGSVFTVRLPKHIN